MIESDGISAFRLVRRLALGQGTSAMYLLVCSEDVKSAVEDDLKAETEIQFGSPLPFADIEVLLGDPVLGIPWFGQPIFGFRFNELAVDIVGLVDAHVVRLERSGSQLLFLATDGTAEQLLVRAPNFRSRLTEVLRIIPDPSIGEQTA